MLSLAGAPFISQEECAGDLFSRGDEVLLIDLSFSDNTSPLKEKYHSTLRKSSLQSFHSFIQYGLTNSYMIIISIVFSRL